MRLYDLYRYATKYQEMMDAKRAQHERQLAVMHSLQHAQCDSNTTSRFLFALHDKMLVDSLTLYDTASSDLVERSQASLNDRNALLARLEQAIASGTVCEMLPVLEL